MQTAFISGGSRGIGRAIALEFVKNGINKIAILATNQERLEKTKEELKNLGGEILDFVYDIRDFKGLGKAVKETVKHWGRIDVLINNAAVIWAGEFIEEEKESIDQQIDVNLKGVLYGTRIILPYMYEAKRGVIINISSGVGLRGIKRLATYSATKFALVGFGESLAPEVEKYGISIYTICPGAVDTDMQFQVSGKRVGMPPERVAQAISDLLKRPSIKSGEYLEVY